MKNSNDTIGNQSHNLLVCSPVPQPLQMKTVSTPYISACKLCQPHTLVLATWTIIGPALWICKLYFKTITFWNWSYGNKRIFKSYWKDLGNKIQWIFMGKLSVSNCDVQWISYFTTTFKKFQYIIYKWDLMIFFYQNIGSIENKINEILYVIPTNPPHVLCFTENHLKSYQLDNILSQSWC
jgi:hypothetical protein